MEKYNNSNGQSVIGFPDNIPDENIQDRNVPGNDNDGN